MLLHLKKAALGLKDIYCESTKHCPGALFLTGVKEKASKAKEAALTYGISKSGPWLVYVLHSDSCQDAGKDQNQNI